LRAFHHGSRRVCVCWLTQGDIVTLDVTPHASFLLKQAQQNYKWSEVKWRERHVKNSIPKLGATVVLRFWQHSTLGKLQHNLLQLLSKSSLVMRLARRLWVFIFSVPLLKTKTYLFIYLFYLFLDKPCTIICLCLFRKK